MNSAILATLKKTVYIALLFSSISSFASPTAAEIRSEVKRVGGVNNFLKILSRNTAKELPYDLNRNLTVVTVVALENKIQYTNKLVNIRKQDIQDIGTFAKENINYMGCNTPVMKILINEFGAKYTYINIDKDNKFLFRYTLDAANCKDK